MRRAVPVLALVVAAAAAGAAPETKPALPPPAAPLAIVDGVPVTEADVAEIAGSQLTALQNQMYTLKKRAVEEVVSRRLLEKEAQARGISVDQLRRVEIDGKITPVTEAEKRKLYEDNKSKLGTMTEEEALKRAEDFLTSQRTRERSVAFVSELRLKVTVTLMMQPPRLSVSADDDPAMGGAKAPVTIIEFSDFQCPYCSRAMATVKELEAAYGDKIRVVYRDLPLIQIHPNAAKAAEAGTCANAQGKFWPMHDRMFANQTALAVDDLKRYAAEIGLDVAAFGECLDSGQFSAEWQKDSRDAQAAGVNTTPAFVINGRLLEGAQPYTAFTEVIDDELGRVGVASPQPAPPVTQ